MVDFKDEGSEGDNARITAFAHNTKKLGDIEQNYYNLSNPLPLTNFFVNRPGLWLVIAFLVLGAISYFVVALGWFKAAPPNNRDYLVWDDPKTIDYDKSTAARALLVAGVGAGGDELPLQSSVDLDWAMYLIYSEQEGLRSNDTTSTSSGTNVYKNNTWSRDVLIAMRDFEAPIRSSPSFQQFCLADKVTVPPASPRGVANPTWTEVSCAEQAMRSPLDLVYDSGYLPNDLETITQDQLDNILQSAVEDDAVWENYKLLFDRYVSKDNVRVRYLRTQLVFAGPIQYDTGEVHEDGYPIYKRYESMSDRYDE